MAEIGYTIVTDDTTRTNATTSWVTPTNGKILGSTLDANTNYLLLVVCVVGGDNVEVNTFEWRVIETVGGARTASGQRLEPRFSAATIGSPYVFMEKVTTDATPTGNDYEFQLRVNTGANTCRVQSSMMLAIKLDDITENTDWFYANDTTSNVDVSSASWTNGASITIGDGISDYLVIGTSHWLIDSVTDETRMQIDVGGTGHAETGLEGEDLVEEHCVGTMTYVAAPASSTTVRVQIRTNAGAHDCDNSTIFALRLNAFEDYAGTRNTTPTEITATATDFISGTLSFTTDTVATENWLFVGQGMYYSEHPEKNTKRRLEDTGLGVVAGDSTQMIGFNGDAIAGNQKVPMMIFGEAASVADATSITLEYTVIEEVDVVPQPSVDDTSVVGFTWELAPVVASDLIPASFSQSMVRF
jgi:hypothetical protein